MKKSILLIASIAISLTSCNNKKETYVVAKTTTSPVENNASSTNNDGYTLMKNNCYACHNPKAASHEAIIAPPFKAVKMHYTREYNTKTEFVNAVVNWVQNPKEEKALMYGAVKRFNVMPKLPLAKKDIEKIANYLYDNEVEQPAWMPAHMKEMKGKKNCDTK